ncbi:LytTR family transcriptional regulator DNA-binding domain-containing protein [Mucilaginibacter litoreus]|uniref:LytTR family transcriptional regulator DNA-binding domain-containing protein n=1 Tax=Mucilaginibacter litoreus TaxID=1048221 RepID=A0ABW3AXF1_9SPHI
MPISNIKEHLFNEAEYPLRFKQGGIRKTVAIQFCLVFVFLLLFKPFGVYEPEHRINYFFICALHALFPSLIIYVYFTTLCFVNNKQLKPRVWTLSREYAHLAVVFLLTGIASFLLRSFIYNNPYNWSVRYLWEEIRNCYLAGTFLYIFLLFASSYFQREKRRDNDYPGTAAMHSNNPEALSAGTSLFIKTQVQQDDFSFNPQHLLFAKADGNYIELTVLSNAKVTTELKRISLKQFDAQLTGCPYLLRCHRAYLVNLAQVKAVSGNALGYTLSLNATDESIPVSRAQVDRFKQLYEQLAEVAAG